MKKRINPSAKAHLQSAFFRPRAWICFALICSLGISAYAEIITVTNMNDTGPGSLRHALRVANDGDTITFAVTGTIVLTSGGLPVNKSLTISGPGKDQLSIDGNQALFVFGIFPDKTATISGLRIRNGQIGIWNDHGTLTVTNCAVSGNSGTGLFNSYGVLTVIYCDVSGNSGGIFIDHGDSSVSNCIVSSNDSYGVFNTSGPGGPNDHIFGANLTIANTIINDNSEHGVYNEGGEVMILNSTLSGNSAGQEAAGGGISSPSFFKNPGSITVINSTISGNSASAAGGGISADWTGLTIVNSTISSNSAGAYGGGIASGLGVMIVNSTVSGNSAATCSGVCGGTVEIGNTILNANAAGNIHGSVTSRGYNVCSDDGGGLLSGPGDQINTDPLLGPLQDNGGPTFTHALLPGSPAIDAGDPNFTPPPFYDQRGPNFVRVFNGRIDIGSFEKQPRPHPTPRPPPAPAPHP